MPRHRSMRRLAGSSGDTVVSVLYRCDGCGISLASVCCYSSGEAPVSSLLNLVLDFDVIEQGATRGRPARNMERDSRAGARSSQLQSPIAMPTIRDSRRPAVAPSSRRCRCDRFQTWQATPARSAFVETVCVPRWCSDTHRCPGTKRSPPERVSRMMMTPVSILSFAGST